MKNYVFVHGAWGEGSEFRDVMELVSSDGKQVLAPDLPGHGAFSKPINEVTMDAYVKHVKGVINNIDGKVILLGHSLAGSIISQVAEEIPNKIESLIYICALFPKDGETAIGLMQSDENGELLPKVVFSECNSFATLKEDDIRNILLHDADSIQVEKMIPKLSMKQATQPFMAEVHLSGQNFGSVPKYFIRSSLDKVLTLSLQDKMIGNWKVEKVLTLQSGHFPMISMPKELAAAINDINK